MYVYVFLLDSRNNTNGDPSLHPQTGNYSLHCLPVSLQTHLDIRLNYTTRLLSYFIYRESMCVCGISLSLYSCGANFYNKYCTQIDRYMHAEIERKSESQRARQRDKDRNRDTSRHTEIESGLIPLLILIDKKIQRMYHSGPWVS